MKWQDIQFPQNHRRFINQFVAVCQADDRVVAASLLGSYAQNAADKYSDIDLFLIISDEFFEDFHASRETFIRQLDKPLFLEDFGYPNLQFYMFPNNTEVELLIERESHLDQVDVTPYTVLLDKKGILDEAVFPHHKADQPEQMKILQQQVTWFWHELSHFIKAMGRRQLWFAYGQIEEMRAICVNLARLQYNFSDGDVGVEPYFKVEQALPVALLAPLQSTFCQLEYEAMLQAAFVIVRFYQDIALNLAGVHGVPYERDLERMMIAQLEELRDAGKD